MPVSIELVESNKPQVYVPKEKDNRKLINVLLTVRGKYAILWFHWPRDGYSNKEDYEPIVLFFRDNLLVAIGTRPHMIYNLYDSWNVHMGKPVIEFTTSWHGATVYESRQAGFLTKLLARVPKVIELATYELVLGDPPEWYDRDDSSMGVHEFAEKCIQKLGI